MINENLDIDLDIDIDEDDLPVIPKRCRRCVNLWIEDASFSHEFGVENGYSWDCIISEDSDTCEGCRQ